MPPKKNKAKGKDRGKAGPKPLPKVRTRMPELRCGKEASCDALLLLPVVVAVFVLHGAVSAAACL